MKTLDLSLAKQEKIRLLVERDPDGVYKVWYDKDEYQLVEKIMSGHEYIKCPVRTLMRMPYSEPTETEISYPAKERMKSLHSEKNVTVSGNVSVFFNEGSRPEDITKIANKCNKIDMSGTITEIVGEVYKIVGDDYFINVARNKIYLYERESYLANKKTKIK